MLLTVLLVQILNFALVVAMPLPTPNVHRIGQIAMALRTGADPSGLLRVTDRDSAPQLSADPGDARFAHRLAADLAVAAALISALAERPISADTVAFGEVSLSGEVRGVAHAGLRLKEAAKLGFAKAMLPAVARDGANGLAVNGFATLGALVDHLLGR